MNVADFLLQVGHRDDVVLIHGGQSVTYADLRAAAGRIAAELAALGLPAGSRVGLVGGNSPFWVASYLAVLKLGLIAVPLSTSLTAEMLRRNIEFVDCAAVVAADEQPAAGRRPVISGARPGGDHWPESRVGGDADAALMFTSGTTAAPRAVRITHRNLIANTESIVAYLGLVSTDRMLAVLPFHYCYGASLLHTHLRVGGSLVLHESFAFPNTALDAIEQHGCTGFAGVPSSYQALLRRSRFGSRRLPSLRLMQQAGGKLPAVQVLQVAAAQPQAQLFVMYGQTEATARLSYLPPVLVPSKPGSIGRGIPGVQLSVVDDEGRRVAPGVVGHVVARGDNISPGYYRDPQATAQKFADGALRTGDLATVDADGDIFIADRESDFIKTWGFRVSGQEVESCALQLPQLVGAAVVGVPDALAGEAIVLFAVPREPIAGAQVLAHLRAMLPKHMVPREVRIIDELPLNAAGKVVKADLKQLAAA